MDEVYCGAPVDGGLCLRGELSAWGMGFHHDQKNGLSQPPDCHAGECHVFIPAYVRCPECDGSTYLIEPDGVETGYYSCQCAAFYPGFIPVPCADDDCGLPFDHPYHRFLDEPCRCDTQEWHHHHRFIPVSEETRT